MELRLVALSALAIAVVGCAAPIMHARTGEVLREGEARVAVATVLYARAESSAVLHSSSELQTRSGTYSDSFTARQFRTRSNTTDGVLGWIVSLEARGAYSFVGGCEVGGLLGFVRIGLELRCALLDERDGAPFSAALSGGVAQQIVGGIGLLFMEEGEDFRLGQELRVGLDLSAHGQDITPLLNVGLGYIHQYREILNGLPTFNEDDESPPDLGEIYVWRDELRLSIPIGLAFELGDYEEPSRGRVIVAIVPEITLYADERTTPRYQGIEGSTVTDFEQTWAVFLTIGAE